MRLAVAIVLSAISIVTFAQESVLKPPYSEPPSLELRFQDAFNIDSRDDYSPGEKKIAVHWKAGQLQLTQGAVLQRNLEAECWVKLDFDLDFPKLTEAGQSSELKIVLDLKGAGNAFILFHQKVEHGKVGSGVYVVDTEDKPGPTAKNTLAARRTIPGQLPNGHWKIEYRSGLWTISPPKRLPLVFGYTRDETAQVNQVVVQSWIGQIQINSIECSSDSRIVFSPSQADAEKLATANSLEAKIEKVKGDGELSMAVAIAEQVAQIRQNILGEYHPVVAQSLNNLAVLQNSKGDLKKAEFFLLESNRIREKLQGRKHPLVGLNLNNLAALYRSMNDFEKAKSLAIESIEISKNVFGKENMDYARGLNNLAAVLSAMSDYSQAKSLYQESLAIRERILGNEHPDIAQSLNNLAAIHVALGDYDQAVPLLLKAKTIYEKTYGKKHRSYAFSLNNLATLYSTLGEKDQLESMLLEAKLIRAKVLGTEHPEYADTLNNLADFYFSAGSYEKAEPLYLQAKEIRAKVFGRKHPVYAASLNRLANLYFSLGDFTKAEPLLLEAKTIRENALGKDHPDYAQSLNNLAAMYQFIGSHEKAEPLLVQTKIIYERVFGKKSPLYAISLNNLATVYSALENYPKAEALFMEAMGIRETVQGKDHPDFATSVDNMAGIHLKKGDFIKSEQLTLKAKAIRERQLGKDHPFYAESLSNLAAVYDAMGREDQSQPLLQESLKITRRNLSRYSAIQSERQQRGFAKTFELRFSRFISTSLRLPDSADAVFDEAITWKGMMLARQKEALTLSQNASTRDVFRKLRRIKSLITKHIQEDQTASGWKERRDQLLDREELLEKEISRLAAQARISRVAVYSGKLSLPPGSCLVDFRKFTYTTPDKDRPGASSGVPHYLGLVLRDDGEVQMIDLGSAVAIEQAIQKWRAPIEKANQFGRQIDTSGQRAMDQAGADLRKLVWEPLSKYTAESNLIIVAPDGDIGRIPLLALPGKRPGTYLIEEEKIVYVPVPMLLRELLSNPAKSIDGSLRSLLVGDISYGESKVPNPDLLSYRSRRVLGELQFLPLSNSGTEIRGINQLFQNATLLSGEKASEASFKQGVRDHQLLHVATHGFYKPTTQTEQPFLSLPDRLPTMSSSRTVMIGNPNLLSGLAFANANAAADSKLDGNDDGILFSAEIALLPMEHVELAVLSACETSLGTDDSAGEGLIGIQRAFQVAGVKSTIASYWKVDDRATQLLMSKFYENLLAYSKNAKIEGAAPNSTTVRLDALRDAQLWMLNNPIVASTTSRGEPVAVDPAKIKKLETKPIEKGLRTHPRYWAAFVLSGDWR